MSDVPPSDGSGFAFDRFRSELDKWLETAKAEGQKALSSVGLSAATRAEFCTMDVVETEESVEIWIDLPGIPADQVQLTLAGNALSLAVDRTTTFPEGRVHLQERPQGPLQRTLPLPAAVQTDSAVAEAHDGVLHVTLKKAVSTGARQIPIRTGTPPANS